MASGYWVLAGLTVDVTGKGTGHKFPLQQLLSLKHFCHYIPCLYQLFILIVGETEGLHYQLQILQILIM